MLIALTFTTQLLLAIQVVILTSTSHTSKAGMVLTQFGKSYVISGSKLQELVREKIEITP